MANMKQDMGTGSVKKLTHHGKLWDERQAGGRAR